jgi:hypothetical protein
MEGKKIKRAVLFGMGYICGKHNLHIPKKERERIASNYAKEGIKLKKKK